MSMTSTPEKTAVVDIGVRDFLWTTISRVNRLIDVRCNEVNGAAMEGFMVFTALDSTSHSLALGA